MGKISEYLTDENFKTFGFSDFPTLSYSKCQIGLPESIFKPHRNKTIILFVDGENNPIKHQHKRINNLKMNIIFEILHFGKKQYD